MFLVLFAPGIISYVYFFSLQKIPLRMADFIAYSAIFAFLINMFVMGVSYLSGHKIAMTPDQFSSMGIVLKYGALAFVTSVALPNILFLIIKFYRGKKNG